MRASPVLFLTVALGLVAGWLLITPENSGRPVAPPPKASAGSFSDVSFVPHKAIYAFEMVGMPRGGGLSDLRGRMLYEQRDACEAWTTDHRFLSDYFYPEQPSVRNTSHYVAWETKDGRHLHFNSERQEEGAGLRLVRGSVERRADGGAVAVFSHPVGLSYDLPAGYMLPMQHTQEMIRRARAGDKIFNAVIFDGTDADGPVEINVVITGAVTEAERRASRKASQEGLDRRLLSVPAWHMRMAVFALAQDDDERGRQGLPIYEMDLVLHENGVIGDTLVDYGTFKVAQTLTGLSALPPAPCPEVPPSADGPEN